ncbi:MAG: porin family protein [Muribaculaceae bacterium]|nr:porin family protein [Muribaculaceae bacterium]
MKNYKKVILTLLVAILGIGAANAQLRFGVKAGLNLNSLHLSNVKDNLTDDNKAGFTGGVMAEFQIPVIGICFDLSAMYTHMSTTLKDGDQNVGLAKNFLEVPINLKYKIGLPVVSHIVTPFIFTGPSFAFRLGGNKKDLEHYVQTKGTQSVWNVGLGVELIRHLQIQAGYGFGMNNIAKKIADANSINANFTKLRNNYWTVTAAWLF